MPEFEENVELHLDMPAYAVEGLDLFVPLGWPEHWRALQGLVESKLLPHGSTATERFAREIAEGAGLSPLVVGDFAANMDCEMWCV